MARKFHFLIFFIGIFVFFVPLFISAQTHIFTVDNSYDLFGRQQIEAQLVREDNRLYFYVEKNWWESRTAQQQNDLRIALAELGLEFQNRIYPVLTSTFGSEPKPGIDGDEKITVLVHQMGGDAGGYFRSGDAYEGLISPGSNEREMMYLNSRYIGKPEAKSFLAHEFTHLITVHQKDVMRRVTEEVWLNEARAEYAPTLLGYDDTYEGSNLKRRVGHFLEKPSDPLVQWHNRKEDYGAVNMFAQYLVDHYGVAMLVDSLQSSQVGISSLHETLRKSGTKKDFSQIFTEWTITVLTNDCSLGEYYCYRNPHLQDLRITPTSYFIPRTETIFSTYHTTVPWSGNWHRFVGGAHNFVLQFEGANSAAFAVSYVLCEANNACSVRPLDLDEEQKGEITLSDFGENYSSLTLIPFVASEAIGNGELFDFSWQVRVEKDQIPTQEDPALMSQLLARIAELQEQVRRLQAQLAFLRAQRGNPVALCTRLDQDMSFGMRSEEVRCLQEFLASQGSEVYPEGLVTGNFLSLTRQAVIRFQEKYASEILTPLELSRGTGYVGEMTRNKINQLLSSLVVH